MRLIDADALLKTYSKWISQLTSYDDEGDKRGVETCVAVLKDAPTIDAEPVRHGRWEKQWDYDYMQYFHFCSECGKDALTKEETMHDEILSFYCPNCGAKMDAKED